MHRIDVRSFLKTARKLRRPFHKNYFAMYSSVYGGIVTDPVLMMVPIDDHMVHRGDGIFEVFKCVNGSIYNLSAHLERLRHSAKALGYKLPCAIGKMRKIVVQTIRAGGHKDCTIHLYVSRGPGSFSVNPYECPKSQLYVVVTRLKKPFMEFHPQGARVKSSAIAVKHPFFAGVKNCNYLPNVLMKKEAEDAGVDFVAAFDARGFLAEGATENMGIVTKDRRLLFPKLRGILAGTTMTRAAELAGRLVRSGDLAEVAFRDISRRDIAAAAEFLIVGTTPNVAAARELDGRPVGGGKPGPIYAKLSALLADDIRGNRKILTKAFDG